MITRFKNRNPLAFRFLVNTLIWLIITAVLVGVFNAIDFLDFLSSDRSTPYESIDSSIGKSFVTTVYPSYVPSTWAIVASLCVFVIGLNIVGADIMYNHAKRCGRNKVAWCIATVFLSPIFTSVSYLLTRPVPEDSR